MSNDVKQLQQERSGIYHDLYHNIIPKRVPVNLGFPNHLLATYGGLDPVKSAYDYGKLAAAAKELSAKLKSDRSPFSPANMVLSRPPMVYQLLRSQSFKMGASGFVQHPEVVGMLSEDYDYLIEDPYSCMLERIIPRQHKALDPSDPVGMMLAMMRAKESMTQDIMSTLPIYREIVEENGFYPGAPLGSAGIAEAPYDFVGDQLRSFSGISTDIRRDRKRVADACEAVLPLMFYWGLPANPHPEGSVFVPLHMPTFMREKDFAEVWMPTYIKLTQQWAACGVRTSMFCEDDWMRYLDHLQDMPAGSQMQFEYGDPKTIKDKLGKKYILTGLYPINLIKTGTKQEVIDKAKEILDIMMPGGGYVFGLDKSPLTLKDINLENYFALAEFVSEYGKYDNAGQSYGEVLNSEGYRFDEAVIKPIRSKYIFDWEAFKAEFPLTPDSAQPRTARIEKEVFSFVMNLLI